MLVIVAAALAASFSAAAVDNTYGRLRSVVLGADGVLYLTTSNGTADAVLRITATQP